MCKKSLIYRRLSLFVGAVLLLCVPNLNAEDKAEPQTTPQKKHQFSVGLKAGLSLLKLKRFDVADPIPAQGVNGVPLTQNSPNKRGRTLGVFGGYLLRNNNWGIGAEGFWEYGPIEDSIKRVLSTDVAPTTVTFEIKQRLKERYGLHVKGGYFVHNSTFLYGLIGFNHQKVDYIQNHSRINEAVADDIISGQRRVRKGLNSLIWGVGVTHQLAPSFSLGIEGTVAQLPKKNISFEPPPATRGAAESFPTTSQFKNTLYTISVKLAYTF